MSPGKSVYASAAICGSSGRRLPALPAGRRPHEELISRGGQAALPSEGAVGEVEHPLPVDAGDAVFAAAADVAEALAD